MVAQQHEIKELNYLYLEKVDELYRRSVDSGILDISNVIFGIFSVQIQKLRQFLSFIFSTADKASGLGN